MHASSSILPVYLWRSLSSILPVYLCVCACLCNEIVRLSPDVASLWYLSAEWCHWVCFTILSMSFYAITLSELTFRCQHSLCNYPSDVLLISHMSVCMHVPLCGLPCIKPMDWYVDIVWSYTYGVLLMRSDSPSVRVQKCAWCGSIQRCAWCGSIWRCAWCGRMLRCAWWVTKICGVCAICCVVTAWGYWCVISFNNCASLSSAGCRRAITMVCCSMKWLVACVHLYLVPSRTHV